MIGGFGGKTVAAMQQRIADLERQVEFLSAHLASTTDRLATMSDGLTALTGQLAAQATEASDAKERADTLAGLMADQAAAIVRLHEQEAQRIEWDRRMRADISRIERQATIDVTELRETSLALAQRLLMSRGTGTGTGTDA